MLIFPGSAPILHLSHAFEPCSYSARGNQAPTGAPELPIHFPSSWQYSQGRSRLSTNALTLREEITFGLTRTTARRVETVSARGADIAAYLSNHTVSQRTTS